MNYYRGHEETFDCRRWTIIDFIISIIVINMTINLELAIRLLRILTPLAASLALVTVAIGLVTAHWLFSEEKMINPKFNRTGDPELEFLSKFTVSGLWTLCYTNRMSLRSVSFFVSFSFPASFFFPAKLSAIFTTSYKKKKILNYLNLIKDYVFMFILFFSYFTQLVRRIDTVSTLITSPPKSTVPIPTIRH